MKQLIKTGFIPYDEDLKRFARKNRREQTEAESVLWKELLSSRQLSGYKFLRQKPVHKYILDFYCSKLSLGIEVDGGSHIEKEEYDERRTFLINGFGIEIMRFSNCEVLKDIDFVRTRLLNYVSEKYAKTPPCPEKGKGAGGKGLDYAC